MSEQQNCSQSCRVFEACQRPSALGCDVCDSEMFSFIGTEEKSPQQLNNKYKHAEEHGVQCGWSWWHAVRSRGVKPSVLLQPGPSGKLSAGHHQLWQAPLLLKGPTGALICSPELERSCLCWSVRVSGCRAWWRNSTNYTYSLITHSQ